MSRAPRSLAPLALGCVLAAGGCDCGEDMGADPSDASILVGEGEFPLDLGPDLGPPPDEAGVDLGSDLGPEDVDPGDLAGPDAPGEPDLGNPCLEPAAMVLSGEEAMERAAELSGRLVRVVGTASAGEAECGDAPCEDGTICCNRCRASLAVDGLALVPSPLCAPTATVACRGGACDPLVCTPPALGVPARFDGVLRGGEPPVLELIRFQP